MRVLHVATLVSSTGEFGGPVTVARGQVAELRRRGHDAVLAGGTREPPVDLPELRTHPVRRLLPGLGFSGLVSPGVVKEVRAPSAPLDLVHVHLTRDLITLPTALACLRRGIPFVLQPHGQVDGSDRALAKILDAVATRRVLRGAASVIALTPAEASSIREVAVPDSVELLGNGVELPASDVTPRDTPATVLFLARLHAIKRPALFVEAAALLHASRPDVRFVLAGPDEGERPALEALVADRGLRDVVTFVGAVDHEAALGLMRRASVYVLPSESEVFPMALLEAMSVGTPVVVSPGVGIAEAVAAAGAGVVADSPAELADAVAGLLDDPARRASFGEAGRALVADRYSSSAVVDRLETIYADVVSRRSTKAS